MCPDFKYLSQILRYSSLKISDFQISGFLPKILYKILKEKSQKSKISKMRYTKICFYRIVSLVIISKKQKHITIRKSIPLPLTTIFVLKYIGFWVNIRKSANLKFSKGCISRSRADIKNPDARFFKLDRVEKS